MTELSDKARELKREYLRAWRERNPDYDKQWRAKNKDSVKKSVKQWRSKNPDFNKEYLRKRRIEQPELRKIYEARMWEKKARELEKVTVTQNKVTVTAEPGQKVCINCGAFYKPKRVTARYCSDNCRVNYNRKYKS